MWFVSDFFIIGLFSFGLNHLFFHCSILACILYHLFYISIVYHNKHHIYFLNLFLMYYSLPYNFYKFVKYYYHHNESPYYAFFYYHIFCYIFCYIIRFYYFHLFKIISFFIIIFKCIFNVIFHSNFLSTITTFLD